MKTYKAIGSGESFAYGSLHATAYSSARLGANARIDKALQAAEMFDVGCSGPFVYEELPATEKVGEGKRNG